MAKILLVNGSPTENGCTYTALCEVASALKAEGLEAEIFQLGKEGIRDCIGCHGCRKLGRCVFQDDKVNELLSWQGKRMALCLGRRCIMHIPEARSFLFWIGYSVRQAMCLPISRE